MLSKLTDFADGRGMLPRGADVIAAVSGGADSMALLTALLELAPSRDLRVYAAHFDHRLRGAESDRDREFVRGYCEKLGVTCHVGSGDAREHAASRGRGVEDAARELRYAFLLELSERFSPPARVATAHTADDNAETVLLNLTRGAGARGLAGIPPRRGSIIRPLLSVTRAEVEAFLSERGVPHVEDSSNSSELYSRNLLRRRVVPVLRELNPRFASLALETSVRLREDDDYLTSLALDFIDARCRGGVAPAGELAALPRPVAARAVIALAGRSLSSERVEAILALCRGSEGSARVSAPGGDVVRSYGNLIFGDKATTAAEFLPVPLAVGETIAIREISMTVAARAAVCESDIKAFYKESEKINKSFTVFLFKKSELCGRIIVRPRAGGDSMKLLGSAVTKSLKKLFIDKKIPGFRRGLIPVVSDELGPLGVCGVAAGARAAPRPGDDVLEIRFERLSDA
ncbi:MAG: tRNA lysidine(34) synthetase TilS [Oscillospiraceae bacterium]|jgi:tRNA(Ile)-lysidine synthase|nr:tRNA lysidine(34) synthetase TilS [Oscillospiraceae bacterium]